MKISELIEQLKNIEAEIGDVEVYVFDVHEERDHELLWIQEFPKSTKPYISLVT